MEQSRRRFLRRTATATGSVALTGLAGCNASSVFGGGGDGGGSTETGTSDGNGNGDGGGLPSYTQWLPAPGELDGSHYQFVTVDPGTIAQYESEFSEQSSASDFTSSLDRYDGVTFRDLSAMHLVANTLVLVGPFDRETFVSGLEEIGYEEGDTVRDYTTYTGGMGGSTIAIGTERILLTSGEGATDTIETFVDVKRGAAERYPAASEDCTTLVTTLGDGTIVTGETHDEADYFDGAVARGSRWTVEGSQTTFTGAVVFENTGEVPVEEIRQSVGEESFFDPFQNPSVSTEGRTAVVTGTAATGDIVQFELPWAPATSPGGSSIPTTSFSFEYDESSGERGTLTITHDGGDTINARRLYVRGTGFASVDGVDMTGPGRWQGTTSGEIDGQPAIVAGDRVTVGVSADYDLSVVWQSQGGDRSATLATDQGPDA